MSKTVNGIPKGTITFLVIAVAFALLQGYTSIYIETLVFIRNNIVNVDSERQAFVANILTLVIYILSFAVFGCSYWSFLRFQRDIPKPYLPMIIGGFSMMFILLAWLKLTT